MGASYKGSGWILLIGFLLVCLVIVLPCFR